MMPDEPKDSEPNSGRQERAAVHLRIFQNAVSAADIAEHRAVVEQYLGTRPDLQPDQRDVKWWINLANLTDLGALDIAKATLRRFCGSPLFTWAREQLGPDLVFVLEYCIMRRFDPVRRPVPAQWHFDANIFGLTAPMVNFWMPLVDVGETAPGLTLAAEPRRPAALWTRLTEIAAEREGGFDSTNRRRTLFANADVAAALADDPVKMLTPRVSAGGAIAFDQQILHGTQSLTAAMGTRDSLEIRLMPLDVALTQRLADHYKILKAPGCRAT